MMSSQYKSIKVSEETYSDLVKRGTFSDTFDAVIQRLLKEKERSEVMQSK